MRTNYLQLRSAFARKLISLAKPNVIRVVGARRMQHRQPSDYGEVGRCIEARHERLHIYGVHCFFDLQASNKKVDVCCVVGCYTEGICLPDSQLCQIYYAHCRILLTPLRARRRVLWKEKYRITGIFTHPSSQSVFQVQMQYTTFYAALA